MCTSFCEFSISEINWTCTYGASELLNVQPKAIRGNLLWRSAFMQEPGNFRYIDEDKAWSKGNSYVICTDEPPANFIYD